MQAKRSTGSPPQSSGAHGRPHRRSEASQAVSSYRDAHQRDVLNRLKRIEGQIRGVIDLIEGGASCEEIAQQMAASRKAMDRAFFRMMACTMMESVAGSDLASLEEVERSTKILEKYA
mgnify:CR=1 FL=1